MALAPNNRGECCCWEDGSSPDSKSGRDFGKVRFASRGIVRNRKLEGRSGRTFAVPKRCWKAGVLPNAAVHTVSRSRVDHAVPAAKPSDGVHYAFHTISGSCGQERQCLGWPC